MSTRLGMITIGQSPRPDMVWEMAPQWGTHVDISERGALDGLTLKQVESLSPDTGMTPLVTLMNDGTQVVVAKEKILPRIERSIQELNKDRVSLILLLCVGPFPTFESPCLVLQPQQIVDRCVEGLIGTQHRLGVLVPLREQETWAHDNFVRVTQQITVMTASPYGDRSGLLRASRMLKDAHCDLVVLYCMGYTQESRREVRAVTGIPVILASSLVARTIGELLEHG